MESHEDNAKKPIYKKWWFWAIIIVLIIIIGTGNFSNDDQLASANTYQTNNSVEVIVVDFSTEVGYNLYIIISYTIETRR